MSQDHLYNIDNRSHPYFMFFEYILPHLRIYPLTWFNKWTLRCVLLTITVDCLSLNCWNQRLKSEFCKYIWSDILNFFCKYIDKYITFLNMVSYYKFQVPSHIFNKERNIQSIIISFISCYLSKFNKNNWIEFISYWKFISLIWNIYSFPSLYKKKNNANRTYLILKVPFLVIIIKIDHSICFLL